MPIGGGWQWPAGRVVRAGVCRSVGPRSYVCPVGVLVRCEKSQNTFVTSCGSALHAFFRHARPATADRAWRRGRLFARRTAFIFLYENQLFLTFRNRYVTVWTFRGEMGKKLLCFDPPKTKK